MKAMRDFALADPENCEWEWDAYIALLHMKETVSGSSSTRFTSPVHHRAPAAAVPAPAPTRSTAPLRGLSGATSSDCFHEPSPRSTAPLAASSSCNLSKDDLSPGARHTYEYITGATDNFHEPATATSFLTSAPAISATRSTTTLIQAATSTRIPVAAPLDSTPAPVHSSLTVTVDASTEPASAAPEVSLVLEDLTMLNIAPITVNIKATELSALMPSNCSSECPSHGETVPVSMLISPAAQTPMTTIGDALSELSTSMAGNKALYVDATSDISTMLQVPTEPDVVQDALLPSSCPSRP